MRLLVLLRMRVSQPLLMLRLPHSFPKSSLFRFEVLDALTSRTQSERGKKEGVGVAEKATAVVVQEGTSPRSSLLGFAS